MQIKMKERKISYTIMIASDSSKHPVKTIQLKAWLFHLLCTLLFFVTVFVVCYIVYSGITLSDAVKRGNSQAEEIKQLKLDYEALTDTNAELEQKNMLLSETINQKVAKEQEAVSLETDAHLPNGFPLSGSAQVKEEAAQGTGGDKAVVFDAAVGIRVIASGDGTVEGVDTDPNYGNVIHINHGNGYVSSYRNAGAPIVKLGDSVLRGTALYLVGEDNTTVVYQLRQQEEYIDPMEMIEING